MIVELTKEIVFGFGGPNLCLLGNEQDFKKLAESISDLTAPGESHNIELAKLDFVKRKGESNKIIFSSKKDSNFLGVFNLQGDLVFELDSRYWERVFKFFVFMSWDKRTYYLNIIEDCLADFDLEQECNFICSSEFPGS